MTERFAYEALAAHLTDLLAAIQDGRELPANAPFWIEAAINFLTTLDTKRACNHPFPWYVDHDWTAEIRDAEGKIVAKVLHRHGLPQARAIARTVQEHQPEDKGYGNVYIYPSEKDKEESKDFVSVDVTRCARCGGDHEIEFRKLSPSFGKWEYIGVCPETEEPVAMWTEQIDFQEENIREEEDQP